MHDAHVHMCWLIPGVFVYVCVHMFVHACCVCAYVTVGVFVYVCVPMFVHM